MIRAGQKLYEERIKRKLTLEEVSKATKIREIFLSAIEKGEYGKLPSSAYAQGFVRNYAEFLGLPKREILALFRREFDTQKAFKVLPDGFSSKNEFSINRIKFQEISFSLILLLFGIFAYITFQYRYAIINPPLEVYFPKENSKLSSKEVAVFGKTDPGASLYVNNNPVSLDNEGVFKKNIELFPGKKTIIIRAVNSLGKETKIERHIDIVS
ncbi:helix-turn-helix domain-containing protein, partial [Patescibacteria group bacterium]|nr:helix-turn-helix domain-containing protein [Patescibacteria group bacterium]